MQIGKFKISPLEFGHFRLDGGAMFGVIPRVLWERYHPADEKNTIAMTMRCMLIEVDDRKILVDTGFGEGRSDKFKKIFSFQERETFVDDALKSAGLIREQITDVIISHLHFDHTGGATIDKATDPKPAFPNARYYIQKKQLEHARSRLERDKASYLKEDFEPLVDTGAAMIIDGEWELMKGIDTIIVNGHTPCQQLVRIQDDGKVLVFAADLIPLAVQFNLPWIMAYDLYPVTTLEEKKRILSQAVDEDWTFFFEHDPKWITGKVIRTEKGYTLNEG
ncbi:MAG: MBL fold metallo-hydrolase [Candidatus Hatepunaea meridiana]|nr:MBL fold metallo-hydrolase [Candidatus Hatepunaea meridiana]